jgi:hypothetical protein
MPNRLLAESAFGTDLYEQPRLKHTIESQIEFLHLKQINSSDIKAANPLFFNAYFVYLTVSAYYGEWLL